MESLKINLKCEGAPIAGAGTCNGPPFADPPSWEVEWSGESGLAVALREILNARVATVDWYRPHPDPFTHYFLAPDEVFAELRALHFVETFPNQFELETEVPWALELAATAILNLREKLSKECAHTQYLEDDDAKRDRPYR